MKSFSNPVGSTLGGCICLLMRSSESWLRKPSAKRRTDSRNLIDWRRISTEIQGDGDGIETSFIASVSTAILIRIFIDTKILVYRIDDAAPKKRDRCRALFEEISNEAPRHRPVISTQVLSEYYSSITTKLKIDPFDAKESMKPLADIETVIIDVGHIDRAIEISILHRLSFWDGLILSAASGARCEKILTEDMNHGQTIAGVLIENPFR